MGMFKKAEKTKQKARIALEGYAGSGKTFTALRFAMALAGPGGRVAVIDTEHGSASLYAGDDNPDGGKFDFDLAELKSFEPERYVEAIKDAERAGYDVIVIDSMSHAWDGQGGILDQVGGNFNNWAKVSTRHKKMVEAILRSSKHVIATMRSKADYLTEEYTDRNGNKKQRVSVKGTKAVQKDNVDYEFTVVGMLDENNTMSVKKTRCRHLKGRTFAEPGKEVVDVLNAWLNSGSERAQEPEEEHGANRSDPVEDGLVEDFVGRINAASTEKELTDMAPNIKAANLQGAAHGAVTRAYIARRELIKKSNNGEAA